MARRDILRKRYFIRESEATEQANSGSNVPFRCDHKNAGGIDRCANSSPGMKFMLDLYREYVPVAGRELLNHAFLLTEKLSRPKGYQLMPAIPAVWKGWFWL